jgi:hypothetical protein
VNRSRYSWFCLALLFVCFSAPSACFGQSEGGLPTLGSYSAQQIDSIDAFERECQKSQQRQSRATVASGGDKSRAGLGHCGISSAKYSVSKALASVGSISRCSGSSSG